MIYHISRLLISYIPQLNVLHYVTVRAMGALPFALVLSIVLGYIFIRISQCWFRAEPREYTPKTHQLKRAMPSMGGIFIIASIVITALAWVNYLDPQSWVLLLTLISFGAIGAWDDWSKIRYKRGISARIKLLLQILVAAGVTGIWLWAAHPSTQVYVPFFKNIHPDLGWWFVPWAMLVLIGTSNAVNLTDGLDGLAIGTLIGNIGTFSIVCYVAGHYVLSSYLGIPSAHTAELTVVGAAMIGSSLGFLWYNAYPAQIFMGDVGSLGLGAGLGMMALMSKQELILPISGGLFVLEALSVIIQVISVRLFDRRVFKMAPLHHHFELLGWQESKITTRFGIISVVFCLAALATLKCR